MTAEGVTKLLIAMTRAYPTYKPVDIEGTAKLWKTMLAEYTDQEVSIALGAFIRSDTRGFAPAIGQLIDLIKTNPEDMTGLEAWGLVNRAIRNGLYGAEDEFARLPDTIKAAVGSPMQLREWAQMDSKALQTVAQSNFLYFFKAASERSKLVDKMPDRMKSLYQKAIPAYALPEPTEEPEVDGIPMPDELGKRRPCCSAECIPAGVFCLRKGHKMPENMDFMSNLRVKIPYPIKFGTKIESLRNGKGMKARHAAKLIGHEPAWLRSIERGLAASININDLEKIAEIYGENADALLKWGWNEKIGEEKAPADNIQGVAESGKARPVRDRKGRKPGRSGTSNRGKDGKTP